MGKYIKENWQKIANKYDFNIAIQGLDSMANFNLFRVQIKYIKHSSLKKCLKRDF